MLISYIGDPREQTAPAVRDGHREGCVADDRCEAGFSGADPEYAGIYLHARYFDPKLGTFLSPDPIGVAGGMNLYGYALGNPVNGTDRSGLLLDAGCWLWEGVLLWEADKIVYRCAASSGGAGGTNSGGSSTGSNGDGGRGVGTTAPVPPVAPPSPPPPPPPPPASKKPNFTVKAGLFEMVGAKGLFTFGDTGFGACIEPGIGWGGEVELSPDNILPDSGFVASGKAGLEIEGGGGMSLETSKNLSTGSAEVTVQATFPIGQQQSLDLVTGTTRTSMNKGIGGAGLLQAGGGVCLSSAW